jgi:hypothetical protein
MREEKSTDVDDTVKREKNGRGYIKAENGRGKTQESKQHLAE